MTRHDNDSFNEWEDERMNIALPGARARQGASEVTQKIEQNDPGDKNKTTTLASFDVLQCVL